MGGAPRGWECQDFPGWGVGRGQAVATLAAAHPPPPTPWRPWLRGMHTVLSTETRCSQQGGKHGVIYRPMGSFPVHRVGTGPEAVLVAKVLSPAQVFLLVQQVSLSPGAQMFQVPWGSLLISRCTLKRALLGAELKLCLQKRGRPGSGGLGGLLPRPPAQLLKSPQLDMPARATLARGTWPGPRRPVWWQEAQTFWSPWMQVV